MEAVLNTKSYLGGASFDRSGEEYTLAGWVENCKLTGLRLFRDQGDAEKIKLEILSKPGGDLLFEDNVGPVNNKEYPRIPINGSYRGRLHVRLTALDGVQPNHCKAVFYGAL